MRALPPPLNVTSPPPSSTDSSVNTMVDVTVIVTGSEPQSKVMVPPALAAVRSASSVQLPIVPSPTTCSAVVTATGASGSHVAGGAPPSPPLAPSPPDPEALPPLETPPLPAAPEPERPPLGEPPELDPPALDPPLLVPPVGPAPPVASEFSSPESEQATTSEAAKTMSARIYERPSYGKGLRAAVGATMLRSFSGVCLPRTMTLGGTPAQLPV